MKKVILILSLILIFLSCLSCSQNNNFSSENVFKNINGKEYYLTNNSKITIGFENNRVYGNASINRYFTTMTLTNDQIIIGSNIGATLMGGSEEEMKNESTYLSDLSKANNISLNDNDELIIKTSENKELVFKQASLANKDLAGREFILENKYANIGITLSFDNEKVYGFSGVNTYFGSYSFTNDNIIIIGPLGSTMMAGSEENMKAEMEFINFLSEASNVSLSITNLEINTKSGEKLVFKDNSINKENILGKAFTLNNMYNDFNMTICFYDADNKVNGFSGVNNYLTSYKYLNNEVKFDSLAMTRKGGSEADMNAESAFVKYLENSKYMYLKGNELIIIANDSTILKFGENIFNAKDVENKEFKLSNMFEGTEITLSINNNSFTGNAGVNNYSIPFEIEDNKIIISQNGISTLMAGAEDDMKAEDEYLKLLNDAKYISYIDGMLCIKTSENKILLFN